MYHVKPILHHVKACHRFVDHTVKLEKAFEGWAAQYASSVLEPYVKGDIRAGETVWASWKRRMVCDLDPDISTWGEWDAKNGVFSGTVFTGRDGKERTVTGSLGFMAVLRG